MKYTVQELEETFADLLRQFTVAMDAERLEWMLIGGLAVGAWTEPRGQNEPYSGLGSRLHGASVSGETSTTTE